MKSSATCWGVVLLSLSVLFLLCGGPAWAQLPADVPSPEIPGEPVWGTSGEGLALPCAGADRPSGIEEYGSFNVNGVLGGLGSTGGYVAVPYDNIFNQNVDGAVEAWIYPTETTSSAPAIVGKGSTTTVGFLFGVSWSSSKLYFRIGTQPTANTDGTTIPLDTWTHVAASWTGTPGAYNIQFFVNGVASGSTVANSGTWNLSADSLWIGSIEAPFGGKDFYGRIDEVRFWADARNASQFQLNRYVGIGDGGAANANAALTSSSAYTGLVASWTFNTGGTQYDDIGGHNGIRRNGATSYSSGQGLPIPYNLTLYNPGEAGDYVSVPHNSTFQQTIDGSIEAWVKPMTSGLNTIFHKGTTFATTTLAFYISVGNKVGINIGAHNYISTGPAIPMGVWTHVAATWTGGPNFTVRLYVNGSLDDTQTFNLAMATNTDTVWIGRYYNTSGNFDGYIDELRFWEPALTQAEIRRNMFVSGRALLPDSRLLALWNFDGNLNNFSATAGLNGSFANVTGGANNARLSGNTGEADGRAHTTVINRGGDPNPFPGGFTIQAPFKKIPDSNPAGVLDTIAYPAVTGVSTVEAFLSVQHTYVGDLIVTLTAPNGQTRNLLNRHGGGRDNILTFFNDGFGEDGSSSTYRAPWAYIHPIETFGNFGGTPAQGNWILKVSDNAGSDTGWVQGWGLRFNSATGIEPVSAEIPGSFKLLQNYPNPFNPSTAIEFSLPEQSAVTVKIFNLLGQRVAVLADNEEREAGTHRVTWNPATAGGLGSGVYFYRIEARSVTGRAFAETRKMLLLK